jgi:DNA primase
VSSYLEEIRRRLLPSKVVARKVVLKQKNAFEYVGLCPFHSEKTPSFTVSDDKKFFHCFGCGEHGDVIAFISKLEGISYRDATKKLADEAGVIIPKKTPKQDKETFLRQTYHKIYEFACNYYQQKLIEAEGGKALSYLKSRGLSFETIKKFRLGYAPQDNTELIDKLIASFGRDVVIGSKIAAKSSYGNQLYTLFKDRVMFPILGIDKQVIAFGGRAFGDIKPKYINSTDNPLFKKGAELYNLCYVLEDRKRVSPIIVVEGYMDVISLYQSGFTTAVAPLGTAFKPSQLEVIWRYCNAPILLFDGDKAGKMAAKRTAYDVIGMISHDRTVKIGKLQNFKDPDELLKAKGSNVLKVILDTAMPLSEYIFESEHILKQIKTPEQKSDFRKRLEAIASKIIDFDLKNQYRNFFKMKFAELFSKGFKKKVDSTLNNTAVIEVMESNGSYEYELLTTLILYPGLLKNNGLWEKFADLDLKEAKHEEIRTELLYKFDKIATMVSTYEESEELFAQLSAEICELFSSFYSFKIGQSSVKNVEDAKVYAIRLLKLISIDKLEVEIQELSDQIVADPNESDFIRLSNLKNVHEKLKLELGII